MSFLLPVQAPYMIGLAAIGKKIVCNRTSQEGYIDLVSRLIVCLAACHVSKSVGADISL
jgi:hypothetical protein